MVYTIPLFLFHFATVFHIIFYFLRVGALPGAAAGALVGGVGASVQNAAKQVWNYLFG